MTLPACIDYARATPKPISARTAVVAVGGYPTKEIPVLSYSVPLPLRSLRKLVSVADWSRSNNPG